MSAQFRLGLIKDLVQYRGYLAFEKLVDLTIYIAVVKVKPESLPATADHQTLS